eukprot:6212034-Pleurochrysis_carterae.AAC.1
MAHCACGNAKDSQREATNSSSVHSTRSPALAACTSATGGGVRVAPAGLARLHAAQAKRRGATTA